MSQPKVTLKTPSEEIITNALQEFKVTTKSGRTLTLREPPVLAQFNLIEGLGGQAASNSIYVQMVLPLLFIAAIDGEEVLPPVKKPQVDALIQRLGYDGVNAATKGVKEHFSEPDPEATKAAVKN